MFRVFVINIVWEIRSESYIVGFYGNYLFMINFVLDF